MGRQSMKLREISLAFLVFVANLACVEDLLSEGTCNWTCMAESGDMNAKELQKIISQGKLIKLKFMYDELIDDTCVSQTNAYSTSASAKVWLKMMAADNKPLKLETMLSQTVLEGIYSGQFVFGGYNEIYVSCIYSSTTKPATNQLQRLAFHTPQSVMYYVENLANDTNSKNYTFLTLMRMEKQTRITFGATSTTQNSSVAPGKDSELLIYSDGWLFVSIVIWTAFVLYSAAVFLLCLPSDVAVQYVRKTREEREDESLLSPVQEEHEADIQAGFHDGNNINHAEEHDEFVGGNLSSSSCANTPENGRTTEQVLEDEEITTTHISMEAQTNETGHSEMVAPSRHIYRSNRKTDRDQIPHDGKILDGYDKQPAATNDNEKIASTSAIKIVAELSSDEAATFASNRSDSKELMGLDGNRSAATVSGHTNNEVTVSIIEPSSTNDKDVIASTSAYSVPLDCNQETRRSDASAIADELSSDDAATSASNRNDVEGLSGLHGNRTPVILDTIEPVNHSSINPTPPQLVSRHSKKYYTHTYMIIVGGPCPTAIGSWIGNVFFLVVNRNVFSRLVLFILISSFPLMFIGLGDFFLLLLPSLHSNIAFYLPYPYLTSSMFNFLVNNTLILRVLVLFSFICYCIRSLLICGFISCPDTITWNSCFVHRRHFECYFYELFQSFLSEFDLPKSFCNWSSRCQGSHLMVSLCTLLGLFNRVCSSLQPCEDCRNSPPKCPTRLEVPENISHNLKKQPDVFIKFYSGLSMSFQGIICFIPMVIVLFVDIIFSSPLVCLCHCRVRVLKGSLKDKFGRCTFLLPSLELLLICFSLVWILFFSLSVAVIMAIAIIGLIITLSNHSNELLPHVTILVIACHYFWSCYSSFTMPYYDLVKKLFDPYREKFEELEKKREVNILFNYKQGEHVKLIPKYLFYYACEHKLIDMPVRVHMAKLLVKLVLTLLLFWFVFLIIRAPSSEDHIIVITFLIGGYKIINDAINGGKIKHSQKDVDRVFDDYFKGLSQQ